MPAPLPESDSVEHFLAALAVRAITDEFVALSVEVTERIAIEASQIFLIDRLRAAVGEDLIVEVGGHSYAGTLVAVLADAIRIERDEREYLLALGAIDVVPKLTQSCREAVGLGHVELRLGMSSALRHWLGQRVCIELRDGSRRSGVLTRVGADQIDLLTPRVTISIAAICIVELG